MATEDRVRTSYSVGIDIGGTFTDIVLLSGDGQLHTKKVSSSVDDYARAIVDGLAGMFEETGLAGDNLSEIRHGTTIGSNAILERKGARTGLIGTAGFRDVLDIRTLRMPRLYDLRWEKPAPLVERYLRATVAERVDARGRIQTPLDPADAERAVLQLLAEDVEAIAICLINSFANPVHELAIKQIVLRLAPALTVCTSFEVLPEIKEYERTSTTVVNAYLKPVVARYLQSLRASLDLAQIGAPILLMQSSGGLTTDRAAVELPVHIVESGPAGGVIGSQVMAEAMGLPRVISFDMGGTTAKASLIEDGGVTRVHECEVGGGVIAGSRLLTGAGYTLKVPAIDLAEVGAGGGSILWIDAGGSMRVGPNSAGAAPGPVCYDKGGVEPTITDANVVLGYINPAHLVGGSLKLNATKSRQAIDEKIARPLGLSVEHAAHGAHQIAAANMIRAIKSVSTERGRDPREYVLFAFGGNGPLFAAGMAAALGMKRIVVPPVPGLFSSFGLLCAKVEHHYSRTFRHLLRQVDLDELNAAWNAMLATAREQLLAEGFAAATAQLTRSANLHYQGQTYELTVTVPDGAIDHGAIAAIAETFGREHERTYGHRAGPDEPVELVTILVTGRGLESKTRVPERIRSSRAEPVAHAPRQAYFGPRTGWLATPVVSRSTLSATARPGPLIVEEYDATCLVPPSAHAMLDVRGNIVIELDETTPFAAPVEAGPGAALRN
jgi:N-methylhydantoinase A